MRTLVTGSAGYIGTVMVPVLTAAGHEVVGLDTGLFAACTHGPAPHDPPTLEIDLRDVQPSHLEGFEAVVHLAALSNDPLGDLEPEHTHAINHAASVRLAEVAKQSGVRRFLYASSCSVYGAASSEELVDEQAPMRPVTAYAVSKVRVEDDLHALADERFSPTYLRNATAFGWSPRLRTDLVLNDLVARAVLTGEVRVLSDGTPWRPLVHVQDFAAAFLAALEAPREAVHDEALNVGSEKQNHQVRDLAEIVAGVVGDCEVVITGETGADPRSYRVDFRKIGEQLPAFTARWSAERGARQLADAYRQYGLNEEIFRERFKRLPWLSKLQADGRIDDTLRWRSVAIV